MVELGVDPVASSSAIVASVFADTEDDGAVADEEIRQANFLRSQVTITTE